MVELKLGNVESQFADIIQCLSVYVNVESLRMKMESYHHL